jgi:putative DNA methylase
VSNQARATLLESGFPWQSLRDIARREGTVKPPIYAMHRWWARRSPTLFRFILAASSLNSGQVESLAKASAKADHLAGAVVLDPFVGGGTSLVEAARLGADVVGYDVEPLAAWITSRELAAFGKTVDWAPLEAAIEKLKSRLSGFYPAPRGWTLLHYFWVASIPCKGCRRHYDAHPSAVLAANPAAGYQVAVCLSCSRLHQVGIERLRIDCSCGRRTRIGEGNTSYGLASCPHCGFEERLTDCVARIGRLSFRLFAKELIKNSDPWTTRRFAASTSTDLVAYQLALAHLKNRRNWFPRGDIPPGRHDQRPQVFGITTWDQMFNGRQLLHHSLVLKAVTALEEPARGYAQLAFSESLATNCMSCVYSPAYRRIAAAFSIHGYMNVLRPTELNPWVDGSGRGTLLNCIRKVRRGVSSVGDLQEARHQVYVGSSERMSHVADSSVDVVLTDPPFYHDNLEYDRLASFYASWRHDSTSPPDEAVPLQVTNGEGEFAGRLAAIFRECARVVKADGLIAFTFAHARSSGWEALDSALQESGLCLTAAIPVEAEGTNGFHSHPGSLKWNGLFVCRKASSLIRFDSKPLREALDDRTLSEADRVNLTRALTVANKLAVKGATLNGAGPS